MKRKIIIIGACIALVGILIAVVGFAMGGFNIEMLNTKKFVTTEDPIDADFDSSAVSSNVAGLKLLPSEEGAAKAVEALRDKGVKDVIVTMGSKGSMVYHEGKATFVPSQKVNAVDTTAAGDTYCGGLCVALSEGKDIIEAARFATAASALTVQKQGAQESIPYRKDI